MLAHVGDLTFEIRSRAEGLVHRCESQVGDFVEISKRIEEIASPTSLLGISAEPEARTASSTCWASKFSESLSTLAALACATHTFDNLFSAERLRDAAALHDRENCRLDRGESAATLGARTAPPDRLALVGLARIDHSGIRVPAERAMHRGSFVVAEMAATQIRYRLQILRRFTEQIHVLNATTRGGGTVKWTAYSL